MDTESVTNGIVELVEVGTPCLVVDERVCIPWQPRHAHMLQLHSTKPRCDKVGLYEQYISSRPRMDGSPSNPVGVVELRDPQDLGWRGIIETGDGSAVLVGDFPWVTPIGDRLCRVLTADSGDAALSAVHEVIDALERSRSRVPPTKKHLGICIPELSLEPVATTNAIIQAVGAAFGAAVLEGRPKAAGDLLDRVTLGLLLGQEWSGADRRGEDSTGPRSQHRLQTLLRNELPLTSIVRLCALQAWCFRTKEPPAVAGLVPRETLVLGLRHPANLGNAPEMITASRLVLPFAVFEAMCGTPRWWGPLLTKTPNVEAAAKAAVAMVRSDRFASMDMARDAARDGFGEPRTPTDSVGHIDISDDIAPGFARWVLCGPTRQAHERLGLLASEPYSFARPIGTIPRAAADSVGRNAVDLFRRAKMLDHPPHRLANAVRDLAEAYQRRPPEHDLGAVV